MMRPDSENHCAQRAGFSLLEVLVACGILVVGLAGIAAIMPAAGARLGEASAQDRAAAAVENAFVDISARGLVSKDLFLQAGATTYSGTSAALFGAAIPAMPAGIPNIFPVTGNTPAAAWLATRIDTNTAQNRGFFLEDELLYAPTDDVPLNSFVDGAREFNRGICWSAMVSPMPWLTPPNSFKVAKVSVAVFRKPPTESMDMRLEQAAGNVFNVTSPSPLDDAARKTFLKPCGFLLAVPMSSGTAAPQWLEINSSWMRENLPPQPPTLQVSLRSEAFSSATVSGPIRAIGFDNLLTVTERIMTVPR